MVNQTADPSRGIIFKEDQREKSTNEGWSEKLIPERDC